jgi:hypothetical protein
MIRIELAGDWLKINIRGWKLVLAILGVHLLVYLGCFMYWFIKANTGGNWRCGGCYSWPFVSGWNSYMIFGILFVIILLGYIMTTWKLRWIFILASFQMIIAGYYIYYALVYFLGIAQVESGIGWNVLTWLTLGAAGLSIFIPIVLKVFLKFKRKRIN